MARPGTVRRRQGVRARALAAFAITAVAASLAAAPRATAAPLSDCTAHTGTIIAVDYGHWGGPIVRGCGVNEKSGYDLLHAAGFTTAADQHDGPAFVCRLGDSAFPGGRQYPTPSQEDCVLTPPASAYWSFWLAPAGSDHWTYSQLGAMSEVPRPGEVELWIFGATNIAGTRGSGVPRYSPAALRAGTAAPQRTTPTTSVTDTATTTTTTTTSAPGGAGQTAAASDGHGAGRGQRPARPSARRRAHVAPSHTASSPTATITPTTASSTSPRLVAARPTSVKSSSGSATPLIIGGCAAALLIGGAGWTAWRRRELE